MTTLRDRRSTSTSLAARDITRDIDRDRKKRRMEKVRSFEVKNDIALVWEQWKSGKCNWNERNDEFRIEFYDFSAIGNLCGKIGARKLEEQGKKFSGGSVQQVWTHSTREERGQVCEFREEFDPRGRIAGPLYQDPSKG